MLRICEKGPQLSPSLFSSAATWLPSSYLILPRVTLSASRLRNNNSSRFGKFLTLQFSATGRMLGASMRTYLLEKSRLTSQLPGEQNYHVLYTVAKGLSAQSRKEFGLPSTSDVEGFKLLNVKKNDVEWEQFPCTFAELSGAMHVIPHLDRVQESCWKVVMAVLYLGNVEFSGAGEDDAVIKVKRFRPLCH